MTTTSLQYIGAACPLGGMGQWAGTWTGNPVQPSQLNNIRNGTGRFWNSTDFVSNQNTSGQFRPMLPMRDNGMVAYQGSFPTGATWNITNGPGARVDFNMQGNVDDGFTVNVQATTTSAAIRNNGLQRVITVKGQGGAGGQGISPRAQAQVGGNGRRNGTTINHSQPTMSSLIYNFGTIYGGGGGGGGGGGAPGIPANPISTDGAGGGGGGGQGAGAGGSSRGVTLPRSAAAGQSNPPWAGGVGGIVSVRNPSGGTTPFIGASGGGAGGAAQAGAAGGQGQANQTGRAGGAALAGVGQNAIGVVSIPVQGTRN